MIPFKKITIVFTASLFLGLFLYAFLITKYKITKQNEYQDNINKEVIINAMKIKSPAFENNQPIPQKYTCDGEDINPPLEIMDVPENSSSLVIIIDDPDSPSKDFVHWLVWNINPDVTKIDEGQIPEGSVQGFNDFGNNNYGGPCPPTGTHRYQFNLYALDINLDLKSESNKNDVKNRMSGHIITQSQLVGLYERK